MVVHFETINYKNFVGFTLDDNKHNLAQLDCSVSCLYDDTETW